MSRSIVINREFGSGGREIGRRLAEKAGMAFYDSRILKEAARSDLPKDLLDRFDERVSTGHLLDLSAFTAGDPELQSMPFRLHDAIAQVVIAAASQAPAVFIGRCSDHILQDAGLRFRSVFVYSTDRAAKIRRAVEVDGVAESKAQPYIDKMDADRRRYQRFFADSEFGDYREYDLCLNSGRLGYDACVDVILRSLHR